MMQRDHRNRPEGTHSFHNRTRLSNTKTGNRSSVTESSRTHGKRAAKKKKAYSATGTCNDRGSRWRRQQQSNTRERKYDRIKRARMDKGPRAQYPCILFCTDDVRLSIFICAICTLHVASSHWRWIHVVGPSSECHDRLRGFGPCPFAPASEDQSEDGGCCSCKPLGERSEGKVVERVECISGVYCSCVCGNCGCGGIDSVVVGADERR